MKRLMITIVTIVGLLLVASLAHADMGQLELYYNDHLTKKIVNCKRIASTKKQNNPCIIRLVEMRSAQANFYKKHREELIKEMVARNIGTEQHKVDYFLTTKFQESL